MGAAYAASKNNTKDPTRGETDAVASQVGINGGIIANFSKYIMFDGGVSIILPSATYDPPTPGAKVSASQTIIGLNTRMFWRYSEKLRFVPSLFFINASGTEEANGNSGDLNSLSSFGFGIGIEYTVGDFLIVGGPGFNINSWTIPQITAIQPQLSNSSFIFPIWNLGAEWLAVDWLVIRLGYTASTSNTTTQSGINFNTVRENTITQYSPGTATLGLGFRFGNFSIDGVINSDVVRQGFGNIGGGRTFSYVSTSYAF